jgi:tyrosyl-tRNA synthetase
MKIDTNEKKIDELLSRGVNEVINKNDLKKKLLSGKRLNIKFGIDPTSTNIHIGRAVLLLKLRDFQKLGHRIILLVGDSTGVIGDTSDKDSERPMLSKKIISENMKSYFKQAGKIIDISKTKKVYNSKWLNKLGYNEIGEHADLFSVSDFISRDNIKKRLNSGKRVSLRELLYPLMQGYDSVVLEADIEIGGTDQRFNLLAGRTMQEHFKQKPQDIIMTELLIGLDGRKMSSSWGNTINILDKPDDMYGKIMSGGDDIIIPYFTLCTRVPLDKIKKTERQLKSGDLKYRDVKMELAKEIVSIYYNKNKAEKAEINFIDTFQKKVIPKDINKIKVNIGDELMSVLVKESIVSSKSEFRRLVAGGAISNMENKEKIIDVNYKINKQIIIKIGKKNFIKIEV